MNNFYNYLWHDTNKLIYLEQKSFGFIDRSHEK